MIEEEALVNLTDDTCLLSEHIIFFHYLALASSNLVTSFRKWKKH